MSKITYANKVAINENAEIPNINKITDDDMNEIKTVVNNNDDDMITINTKLINATTYSTDEKVVGKFFGKTLYSKTIINHPLTSGEQVFVDTGLQVSSIEHIFFDKSASFLIRNNGNVQCGIGSTGGFNFDTRYFSKTDGVNWKAGLYIGESIYQDSTVYVTICYTKTTD